MPKSAPRTPLRPFAFVVSSLIIIASSLLISTASFGRPSVSGYGIEHDLIAPAEVAVR
jgi:hypothetical protein